MDLRALRTFLAVVDAASFSRAAVDLGYTQSAVSQQLAGLERDLGVSLLTRRPVAPTAAGQALVARARDLLARADAAAAQVRRQAGASVDVSPPRLAMSAGAEVAAPGLPAGLASVVVRPSVECADLLARGLVDLAVLDGVTAPSDPLPVEVPPEVVVRVLAETGVGVLLPADHPLAGRRGLDLGALAAARWLDAPRAGLPLTELEAAGRVALRRGASYDGAAGSTVAALVAGGAGLAAVASGVPAPAGCVVVPLTEPRLTHRVELWRHAVDRPAVALAAVHIAGPDDAS